MKHEDYNIITAKIITLFPTEATQTYYIPSIRKNDSFNRRSIVARGKLVDKARNLIHKSGLSTRKRKLESRSYIPAKVTTFSEYKHKVIVTSIKIDSIFSRRRN